MSTINESENTTQSPEFLQYIKERDEARQKLQEKEQELLKTKGRSYELMKKIEELELQVKELKKSSPKSKPTGSKPLQTQQQKSSNQKSKAITREEKASKNPKKGTIHPIIPGKEDVANDSIRFYQVVGELAPKVQLSVVLKAEKRFLEGDVNGDGLIDADNLFTNHFALYTKKQTEEILQSVDTDGSSTLDFIEVLEVLQNIGDGRKTNLPHNSVQTDTKGTAICLIQ